MELIISIFILLCLIIGLYLTRDKSGDTTVESWKYLVFLILLITIVIISGKLMFQKGKEIGDFKSKHPIKPTIDVHCINGKCDTTYIYTILNKK
jgi:predicted hydrocarbon binding protein